MQKIYKYNWEHFSALSKGIKKQKLSKEMKNRSQTEHLLVTASIYLIIHSFLRDHTFKNVALLSKVPTSQICPVSFSFLLMIEVATELDRKQIASRVSIFYLK